MTAAQKLFWWVHEWYNAQGKILARTTFNAKCMIGKGCPMKFENVAETNSLICPVNMPTPGLHASVLTIRKATQLKTTWKEAFGIEMRRVGSKGTDIMGYPTKAVKLN